MSKIVEEVKAIVPSKVYMKEIDTFIKEFQGISDGGYYRVFQKYWAVAGLTEPHLFSCLGKDRQRSYGCLTQIKSPTQNREAQFKYITEGVKKDTRIAEGDDELCAQLTANRKSKKVLKEILIPYAQWQTYVDKRLKRSMGNESGLAQTLRRKIVS